MKKKPAKKAGFGFDSIDYRYVEIRRDEDGSIMLYAHDSYPSTIKIDKNKNIKLRQTKYEPTRLQTNKKHSKKLVEYLKKNKDIEYVRADLNIDGKPNTEKICELLYQVMTAKGKPISKSKL